MQQQLHELAQTTPIASRQSSQQGQQASFELMNMLLFSSAGIISTVLCLVLSTTPRLKILFGALASCNVGATAAFILGRSEIERTKDTYRSATFRINREKDEQSVRFKRAKKKLEANIHALTKKLQESEQTRQRATQMHSIQLVKQEALIKTEQAAVATLKLEFDSKLQEEAEQIETEFEEAFEERVAEGLQEARAELEETKLELLAEHEATTEQTESELKAAKLALKETEQEIEEKLDQDIQEQRSNFTERIKAAKGTHVRRQQQLHEVIESLKLKLEQSENRYREEFEIAKSQYASVLDEYEQSLKAFDEMATSAAAEYKASHQSLTREVQRLQALLQMYHNPKNFTGSALGDHIGNRVLTFFLKQGITLDAERFEQSPTHVTLFVRPRGTTADELSKLSDKLQIELEVLEKPKFKIEAGCISIKVRHAESEKLKTEIERLPEDFIFEIIKQSNHYRIAAPTEYGKSNLLDNLIWALQIHHLGQMRMTLFDPKYPFTDWVGHSPEYKGFGNCLKGFSTLADLIDNRFSEATVAVEAGRGIPDFKPHLFAVDEMESLFDEGRLKDTEEEALPKGDRHQYVKKLGILARRGLKIGRGLGKDKGTGLILAYITQSPLCSRLNLNRDDFFNSTNIILGEDIDYVLENEFKVQVPEKMITNIKRQIDMRREAGEKFFALIKMGPKLYVWDLPDPGAFAKRYRQQVAAEPKHTEESSVEEEFTKTDTARTEEPTSVVNLSDVEALEKAHAAGKQQPETVLQCPHCSSIKLSPHGTYKKKGKNGKPDIERQRYKCSNCTKTTSTPVERHLAEAT